MTVPDMMNRERRITSRVGLIALAAAVPAAFSACGGGTVEFTGIVESGGTVAVGNVPDPLSNAPTVPPPPPSPSAAPTSTSTLPPQRIDGAIGEAVDGDRLIFIGDSLLASMSPNDNARLCDVAESFGWEVEIDSQSGATIEFADTVIDARFPDVVGSGDETTSDEETDEAIADWDVAALVFGSELDRGDDDAVSDFERGLDDVVARLAPRPTILYTVTETDESREQMNAAIRAVAELHPNAVLIDFAELGGPADEVLEDDGRRFNEDGRKRFSVQTAAVLAEAPGGPDGRCLGAVFDDESPDGNSGG